MAEFEFATQFNGDLETIEAYDYVLDTKNGNLTFTDGNGDKIASFATEKGAYVKRVGK